MVPGMMPAQRGPRPVSLTPRVMARPTPKAMRRLYMAPRLAISTGDRNLRMRPAPHRCIRLLVPPPRGPLSKLVDEADSKSAAADPASRFESGEGHSWELSPAESGGPPGMMSRGNAGSEVLDEGAAGRG